VLEDRVLAHWLVSQCLVVGDAKPYIAALVTADPETFVLWKADNGKPETATIAELRDHAPNAKGNFCFEVTLGYRRVERGR
jgi:long-chain acyl-CoA synthetase